jgi:hypothetical protein
MLTGTSPRIWFGQIPRKEEKKFDDCKKKTTRFFLQKTNSPFSCITKPYDLSKRNFRKCLNFNITSEHLTVQNKAHIYPYIEYHSACPLVGIGTSPLPLPQAGVPPPPPREPNGGGHTRLRVRGGGEWEGGHTRLR